MTISIQTAVSLGMLLLVTAGCRTRGGGGGLANEHGRLHPERIALALKSDFETNGFKVSVVTNGGYHLSFCGSTVTGSVTAATSGVDWTMKQYRWRPSGAAEYDRAMGVINRIPKE